MTRNNFGNNSENTRNNAGINTQNNNMVENVSETDNTNNSGTNNATNNIVGEEDLPQILDSRGSSHIANVPQLDVEDFSSWKHMILVYLDGLKPFMLEILENGPFVPKSATSVTRKLF
ncbi:hypothetical protein Tco_0083993 [Tanacetum coccineum]